jgi:hypothetical protein
MMSDSKNGLFAIMTVLIMAGGLVACAGEPEADTGDSGEASRAEPAGEQSPAATPGADVSEEGAEGGEGEEGGEHDEGGEGEEGGEHDEGGEGEESGVYIGRDDTWDATRRGARLVLTFDSVSDAFGGTVENTSEQTLCAVRVEVHLSGGRELGPTERTDLAAGETIAVTLPTEGAGFESWTAHPEVSACGS